MTYAITDTVNFTAGGRYTEEKKEQVNAHGTLLPDGAGGLFWSCGNANFVGPVFAPIDQRLELCSLPKRSVTYDGWSWLFGVDWQATEDLMDVRQGKPRASGAAASTSAAPVGRAAPRGGRRSNPKPPPIGRSG